MTNVLQYIVVTLLALSVVLQIVILLRRRASLDLSPLETALQSMQQSHERTERSIRDEIARNREEASQAACQSRQELAGTLKSVADELDGRLEKLTISTEHRLESMGQATDLHLQGLQEASEKRATRSREEASSNAQAFREEVVRTLTALVDTISASTTQISDFQRDQLGAFAGRLDVLTQSVDQKLQLMQQTVHEGMDSVQHQVVQQLTEGRQQTGGDFKALREETTANLNSVRESTIRTLTDSVGLQKQQFDSLSAHLNRVTESNEQKLEALRAAVETKLKEIQDDNAKQLEQMRAVVDEKLQGTLEKRLGESFKQVSERLEAVSKGLGEMQVLATGVGDLKRVLANVKTRGTWGEVQLGAMLAEVLAPDQYATNVSTRQGGERVEFAIRLPGRGQEDHEPLLLPLDAKFPLEDYQRLAEAQEHGDVDGSAAAGKQLEARIKQCASDICSKYLNPPITTDFAILYLPTEGLFSEVARRSALMQYVQRECRIVVAGPTTLWAILNSLQMGFKTLAIQKRSSEVWNLLAAVKTEWGKYGEVLEKVQKKLQEASNTVDDAARRTRAIGRKLRGVQELPADEAQSVLMLNGDAVTVIDEDDSE